MKEKLPTFEQCMSMMRKHNAQTREDGFHLLRGQAQKYLNELVAAFRVEPVSGLRYWLLELIVETKSPDTILLLTECLHDEGDAFIRILALRGLKDIDTKDARRVLYDARSYSFDREEVTRSFRGELEQVLAGKWS